MTEPLETPEPLELPTRVGLAGFESQQFCGRDLFGELAGRETFHTLVSLATNGERIDESTRAIIEDIVVCSAVADPHIWPLKLARLAASFGDAIAGFCAANHALAGAAVGMSTSRRTAAMLLEMESYDREQIEARLDAGARFHGFGVPFRPSDERVAALRACLERRAYRGGRYWQLMQEIEVVLAVRRDLRINIAGALGAIGLDLGFSPGQIHGVAFVCTLAPLLANAWEGAEQRAACLQQLPRESIDYRGPPPRRSPRAG